MIIIFGLLCLIVLFTMRFSFNGIDNQYLSKNHTQAIKGIFVIFVFLSHIRTYTNFNHFSDQFVIQILDYLGQLMVAMFLFYSGYGIYESIKNKGDDYIRLLPINRIGKTFFDFTIAILLYLLLNMYIGQYYSLPNILLSLTGWTSVGNSNWYMFAIFTLYIITFLSFTVCGKKRFLSIVLVSICSLVYIYFLVQIQPSRFSNTYLCYVAGMWYSYFKTNIDEFFHKYHHSYYLVTLVIISLYIYTYPFKGETIMLFNCVSILFCLSIVFVSMKITINSKILSWFGEYLFWIYILQRIPMIFFDNIGLTLSNPYLFLLIVLIATLILSKYIQLLTTKIKSLIWRT